MLQEGLLWFDDDDKRSIADKIARAAQRYQQKYGHSPNVCHVHPFGEGARVDSVGDVRVVESKTVLPYHFWLGVDSKRKAARPAASSGK